MIFGFLFLIFSANTWSSSLLSKDSWRSNKISVAKKDYYIKATEYFKKRARPLRHFLDLGVGGTFIESFYPLKTTSHPFFAYINYRKERWGKTKIPIIFSFQYEALFNQAVHSRVHALTGFRYPTSHDLTLFHVDFMLGTSVPVLFKLEEIALELRLLFTHIIGPKDATKRLYFQWGTKTRLKDRFQYGLIVQVGLDMHL